MGRLRKLRHFLARAYSGIIRTESLYALTIRQYREGLLRRELADDEKSLTAYGWSGYSQNDEDGIVQEIFTRIGTTNRNFVEFGSGECLLNTGTYLLVTGWKGLWLDSQPDQLNEIHGYFGQYEQAGDLKVREAFITPGNINELLADRVQDLDLLVIDIDGNDYHIWKALTVVRPRVVMIEYNGMFRPPAAVVQPYVSEFQNALGSFSGASLQALEMLGREKGYDLVGCNFTGSNAFFVRNDLTGDLFSPPFSAAHHYREPWLDAMNWAYTRQPRVISQKFRFEVLNTPAAVADRPRVEEKAL
jgi:hypothetical protein